jgi:hypothetical protein
MPWVGFEPTILTFERAKTFPALDRAATVIGNLNTGTELFGLFWTLSIVWYVEVIETSSF